MGDVTRTKFWHDLWCGDTVLKEAFLVLFGIACAKDAFVADNLELLGDSGSYEGGFFCMVGDPRQDPYFG
jgi:hypothetical protein